MRELRLLVMAALDKKEDELHEMQITCRIRNQDILCKPSFKRISDEIKKLRRALKALC